MQAALVMLCVAGVAMAATPTFPKKYHVKGLINLPYAEIIEPFEAWVDTDQKMSRIDYYGGESQFINRGDMGSYGSVYKIVYETTQKFLNKRTCFGFNGTSDTLVTYQDVFPDLSNYTASGTYDYNNVTYDVYSYIFTENTKKNSYYMLFNHQTGQPYMLHFIGYDNVFGSHYDEYNFIYDEMDETIDPSVFDIFKDYTCGPYPGPGIGHAMHANPVFELVGAHGHNAHAQSCQLDSQFDQFKKDHGRNYHDDTEHELRKSHFRHNWRFIESHNRKKLSYKLAVNHMADFSDEEMKIMRGYRPSKEDKGGKLYTGEGVTDVPSSMDWRLYGAVTPVKDQAICGSCWSFGTTGTIEGMYFNKHKDMVSFSEQALVDCSWGYGNDGCDGGETFRAYKWIMDNKCIPTEESYGQYKMQDSKCHNTDAVCGASLSGYMQIASGNQTALRFALASLGPIAVAMDASLRTFSFYAFGVYYDSNCGNTEDDLDHSVLAIGYGTMDGDDYWLVKNSWSTHWGDQGYFLISMKDNNCGIATDADFPIVD